MNLLDYVLLVIVGYCLVRGIFRGLIKELSSIIGVMGGFYAAYNYYSLLAKPLSRWITHPGYLSIFSFLVIFLLVFLVVSLTGVVIKYLMNISFLGWTDRICGALFGSAKGVLLTAVVLLVLTTFLPRNTDILKQSWVARHLMDVSACLVQMTPKEMKQSFGTKMKEYHQSWQHP
jgi:membrane protein required for colicin V production